MGGFCIYLRVPDIFYWYTRISCGKCVCELAYKVSCLFLSVHVIHKLSILSNDKSGLAYCWCLTMRLGALPADPPCQWEPRAGSLQNLSSPADQKDAKKAIGPLKNGGSLEIICQDSLAGCWCTADLGWLNIRQLQIQASVPQARHLILYTLQFANLIPTCYLHWPIRCHFELETSSSL